MVPEVMTILSEFPLLPGGKVDRLALTRIPPDPGSDSGAPFSMDYENIIADIWSDVLATPAIGPGDDFFDLGGNSLDAMMILSRIEDVFGVELDMEELVRHSTVEAFGRRLEELGARPNGESGGA
jgi:acyl carrier protein